MNLMEFAPSTVCAKPVRLAALWASLALSACAGPMGPPPALRPYTGKPVQALIRDYGKDYAVREKPTGATYVWKLSGTRISGGYRSRATPQATTAGGKVVTGMAPGEYHPPRLETLSCTVRAQVDGHGIITSSEAEGAGCYDLLNFPQLRNH